MQTNPIQPKAAIKLVRNRQYRAAAYQRVCDARKHPVRGLWKQGKRKLDTMPKRNQNEAIVKTPPAQPNKSSRIPVFNRFAWSVLVILLLVGPAMSLRILAQPAQPGTPMAWGHNDYGQLGNGAFMTSSPFGSSVAVPSEISGVQALAAGYSHSLALKSDGTVWAWGRGQYGQLGDGNFYTSGNEGVATPIRVNGLSAMVAVAAGGYHSMALKSDGTVWAWGDGEYGQLGDGNLYISGNFGLALPIQVSGLSGVVAIASGFAHCLALKSDGSLWAWGYGLYGQLGDGIFGLSPTPVQVTDLNGVVAIGAGDHHSLAVKSDGSVWSWGYGFYGQLGDGNLYTSGNNGVATPLQVNGLSGAVAIAGGGYHSLLLKSDGGVWAWGHGFFGQLGDGNFFTVATPVQVSGLTNVVAIAGGSYYSLALKSDGAVWAWGDGRAGTLGDGNFYTPSPFGVAMPVLVSSLTEQVKAIAAGSFHSLVLPATSNPAPAITCPPDVAVSNDPGQCSAVANYPAPVVVGGSGNVIVVCNPAPGSSFPVGTTTVTCTATDASGNTATCGFNVVVRDSESPIIGSVTATPSILRPITNRMTRVTVNATATDNCGGPTSCKIISVTSSDPIIPMPSGRFEPYWLSTGNLSLYLRAGRNTPGVARTYTITVECTDTAGNISIRTVDVTVPS